MNSRQTKTISNALFTFLGKIAGFEVLHAKWDSDILIVKTAMDVAMKSETILVGSDTNLLVLLIRYTTKEHEKIYFMPPPKSGSLVRYLDIHKVQEILSDKVCINFLFIPAILGCDTTSRLFGHGKALGLSLVKDRSFAQAAEIFNSRSFPKRHN